MLDMHSLRTVPVFLFAAAVAVSVYAGQAQDPVARGASILADARKALGGDDKLAAIKTVQARGTVRRGAGEINLEGDLDLSIELPGKYLRKESIILGGGGQGLDRVEGLNGTEAWKKSSSAAASTSVTAAMAATGDSGAAAIVAAGSLAVRRVPAVPARSRRRTRNRRSSRC